MNKNIPELRFPEFTGEWERKKLKEVVEIGRGKSKHRPRDAEFLYGGEYPFIQTGDIRNADLYITHFRQTYSNEGLKQSKLWNINTLCVTIAANIAETAILKIEACFPDSIIGLIPKVNETIVLFVKYQFDKYKIEIQKLSQGLAQDNLNQEKLSNIEFKFPSLSEQQKIATFLSSIDDKLQALKKKKALMEQYKKGVMQAIFSQQIRFKDNNGEEYPDWEMKKLGEVGEFIGGGTPSTKNPSYWNGNIAWLSSSDISDHSIYQIKMTRFITQDAILHSATKIVPPKSILIVSRVGVGKVAVNQIEVCTSQDFTNLVVNLDNYIFLAYLIKLKTNSLLGFNQGTSIKGFVKSDLEELPILMPTLPEQTKIANFLTSIDEKLTKCQAQIDQTDRYKKGLLQKMFC